MNQSTPSGAAAARDLTGKTVGRFLIDARLGAGGMGEVYRARDTKLRRVVALKRVVGHLDDEKSRAQLWKEALCASRLNHPHIAAIYDAFEEYNEVFLVMEYVQGQSLRQRMREPLSMREFLPIAVQCVAALAAAHRSGIQHRDIKPENILLTREGQVKVLDFGVARRLPGDTEGTTVDSLAGEGLMGTIIYMAPEIIEQRQSDDRADIFSLGVVFYEALTGRHPFRAPTLFDTSRRIVSHEPEPASKFNTSVPLRLDAIVARMLAKRAADRYARAADVLEGLQEIQRVEDAAHPSTSALPAPMKNFFATKKFWGAIVACLAVATGGFLANKHFRKPVLDQHAPILITDFDNRTGNAVFNQSVTEAVRESLEQSHYFRVIPRSQVYETARLMGRSNFAVVDRTLGREICERDNCRAVLAGSVVATGPRYEITEELVDPAKDASVLVDTASMNSPADLYSTVDALTKRLRNNAGESLAQISHGSQPLAQVTTSSLEALQRYSQGLDLYAGGNLEGFLPLGESAVALDPNFAMAHLYLARAYDALGNETQALQHLAAAMRGLNRVTERERYLILAQNFEIHEDYEKAADQFRLLTEVYPDDAEAFRGLAAMSLWTGRTEEAVPAEKHALQLAPHSAVDHLNLILDLARLNRFDEALDAYAAARNAGADSPLLHWGSGLAYLGKGDTQNAQREFRRLRDTGGPNGENLASLYQARVLIYQGRLHDAADELRRGLVQDEKMKSETYMPVRHYLLAEIALTQDDFASARAEGELMAHNALRAPESQDLRRAGEILIRSNDIHTADRVLHSLAELRDQHESEFMQSCYYNLFGILELAQNRAQSSIESQRKASVFFPLYNAYLGLGEALAAKHDFEGASQAYEKYLSFEGEILQDDAPSRWVLAHLTLARLLARAGKPGEARKYYDQFLQLWAGADADLAPLRAARAERMQLGKTKLSGPNHAGITGEK